MVAKPFLSGYRYFNGTFISEFYEGEFKHLIKAKGRLNEINKMINSGSLGLNDLDVAEALRDDLETAINLFN